MPGVMATRHIEQTIERMRRDDTEFITAKTVAEFDGCSEVAAAEVMRSMGWTDAHIGPVDETMPAGRRDVTAPDGREFAIIGGRRWTRVAEFLSNGQITARFFVDEATGEVRASDGWKKPKSWPLGGDAPEFVQGILALASAPALASR